MASNPDAVQSSVLASAGDSANAEVALTTFSVLWAIGALFHQAAYPTASFGFSSMLVSLPALLLLLKPQSVPRLMLLVVLHGVQVWRIGPAHVSNHWMFATVVNGTILLAFVLLAVRSRGRVQPSTLFNTFAPVVRIQLGILYFYAVLHKLNSDFIDPAVSCATLQYGQIATTYPFLPSGSAVDAMVIYGTLVIEAAIPILLFVRRTRILGLYVGMLFHFMLALNPRFVFFDFSSIVYACFFLFVPFDFWTSLREREFKSAAGQWVRVKLGGGKLVKAANHAIVALVCFLVLAYLFRLSPSTPTVQFAMRAAVRFVFVLYASALLFLVMRASRRFNVSERVRGIDRIGVPNAWMAVPLVLLLLNGASPYLGLKTESSFSMFSNLRTEGQTTNHLFIPPSMDIAGLQDDLVTIESSTADALDAVRRQELMLPWFEFRARAARFPDASVSYVRNGERVVVARIGNDSALTPPPRLARKFLSFRGINPPGSAVPCHH